MDTMQESLNKEILASVAPNWRNHASLKGKKFIVCVGNITAICSYLFRLDFYELPYYCDKPTFEKASAASRLEAR